MKKTTPKPRLLALSVCTPGGALRFFVNGFYDFAFLINEAFRDAERRHALWVWIEKANRFRD